jgi:hypothetical protein
VSGPEDQSDDAAWRDIVANFGERARLSDDEPPASTPPPRPVSDPSPAFEPLDIDRDDSARFRPPPAPPFPRPRTWQRGLAWTGVLGGPALMLTVGILQLDLPRLAAWVVTMWFLVGFAYLVVVAPRAPREPWDDGSRV